MTYVETFDLGRAALAAGRWEEARDAFAAAIAADETPEACAGMADALWWLGVSRESIEWRERAYAGFRRAGDPTAAADQAIRLCVDFEAELGNLPASQGWLARAERVLADVEEGRMHGWVALLNAGGADGPEASRALIDRALALGRAFDDTDLELCALSELGILHVRMGDVEQGFRYIDEAMAGALAGESGQLDTVVYTGCTMLTACELVSDLQRAREWCRAADEFTRQYGGPFLYAFCRVVYGRILLIAGHWPDAERELSKAVESTRDAYPAMHVRALTSLADLRLRQGRLDEAAALLSHVDDPVSIAHVAAGLALRRHEPAVAAALIERSVGTSGEYTMPVHGIQTGVTLDDAAALELLVESHLEAGNLERAAAAARRLEQGAAGERGTPVAGHAAFAAGRVALASGDAASAAMQFEGALEHFARAEFPLETARARLALARALADEQRDVATAEARGALAAFERLGASADADIAAALLRSWGVGGRTGPRDNGLLSRREQEVLGLLGAGLSNQEIADRLYISRKTAAHHVSNVLSKLGVRNRAEAAAHAARGGLRDPAGDA